MSTITIEATLSEDVKNLLVSLDNKIDALSEDPLGRSSYMQIKKLVGKERTAWYMRVKAGRAPQPDKPGSGQTYSNADIIEYLKDPENYYAPGFIREEK